jgi:hypothetical protein
VLAGEKSFTPLLAHVTLPAGESPATVAVQVTWEPEAGWDWEQATDVVETTFSTEMVELPSAEGFSESPV